MSNCTAQDSDVNGFYLFTTKSVANVGTATEKEHCIIQQSETDIKHVVEVKMQLGGFRKVEVIGTISGKCATFKDPGIGNNLASWNASDSIYNQRQFDHVSFEHRSSGTESVRVRVEEVNLFQNPPAKRLLDQGRLNFSITLI